MSFDLDLTDAKHRLIICVELTRSLKLINFPLFRWESAENSLSINDTFYIVKEAEGNKYTVKVPSDAGEATLGEHLTLQQAACTVVNVMFDDRRNEMTENLGMYLDLFASEQPEQAYRKALEDAAHVGINIELKG